MAFDWTVKITDSVMIIAVLSGPLIAVQLTRYLDDRKEVRGRKLWVYKTLMATRAYTLSPQHVEALNRIDLEFSESNKHEKKVLGYWRQYLDLLGDRNIPEEQWGVKRVELLVELLYQMGLALGYDHDKTQLKNGTYSPVAHGRIEEQQEAIRQGVMEVLQGKRVIPMIVTNLHLDSPPLPPDGAHES
ncbi:MAG: DUF6680 family protein [Chlorobaculum sp.]